MPIDGLVKAVNLIPSEQRAAAKPVAGRTAGPAADRPLGAYVILAVLVFAIAAMALHTLTSNSIKENEAELQRVEQEASAISAQATALQKFADFKQLADSRSETVRAIATSRFPWPETLEDISRALPADVYISAFDGTTLGESGGSSLRGAIQAPSIQLNGCTDEQATVARLMSRLRDVRGVTRVTLAKSERTDTVGSAAAPAPATAEDGPNGAVTTEPCPKGSPPAFEMIVFFERAAVSAAAAPNAGSAAGGPTGATGPTGPTGSAGASSGSATTPASTTSTTP